MEDTSLLKCHVVYRIKLKDGMTKKIQKQEFKVGDKVLLYNSRSRFFAGKPLSKWKGPYIIEEVYGYGAIKIKMLMSPIQEWLMGKELNLTSQVHTLMLKLIFIKKMILEHSRALKRKRYVIQ